MMDEQQDALARGHPTPFFCWNLPSQVLTLAISELMTLSIEVAVCDARHVSHGAGHNVDAFARPPPLHDYY